MKKLILLSLLLLTINLKSQIIFEHKYDSASTYGANGSQLMMIKFEVSGEKYLNINRVAKKINIFNLNHSLFKTISLTTIPVGSGSNHIDDILYLSQNLFNMDTLIEFMYCRDGGSSNYAQLFIYNENGVILFSDSAGIPIRNNVPLQQYPIYNTSLGTKMLLSYKNGDAKVFGLSGTLTTAIGEANNTLINNNMVSYPHPNPSIDVTTIDYKIPNEISQGEIVFYDLQGVEIKRFRVDKTFNSLLISTADIPAGTYFYHLQTSGNISGSKKMVIVK